MLLFQIISKKFEIYFPLHMYVSINHRRTKNGAQAVPSKPRKGCIVKYFSAWCDTFKKFIGTITNALYAWEDFKKSVEG